MATPRKPKAVASGNPQTASLKTPMTFSGGSSGAIDNTTLPKPQAEQWTGWGNTAKDDTKKPRQ